MGKYLSRRRGYWYFVRRVPKELRHLDPREPVKISTGIKCSEDRTAIRAGRVRDHLNSELEAYWRGLAENHSSEAQSRFEQARQRARVLGFEYQPAEELAGGPLVELLRRLERLVERGLQDDSLAVEAALGGVQQPKIMVSQLFETYDGLSRASLQDLSREQLRKWRNPRRRAVTNLLLRVGRNIATRRARDAVVRVSARILMIVRRSKDSNSSSSVVLLRRGAPGQLAAFARMQLA